MMLKRLLVVAALAAAGCSSEEKKPDSPAPAAASKRDLVVEVDAKGFYLEAEAKAGTLRLVNAGGCMLEVCDDRSCRPLGVAQETELPVSGLCTWHIAAGGENGKVEAHLAGGGDNASVRVR